MAFKWESQPLETEPWFLLEERELQDTDANVFLMGATRPREARQEWEVSLALTHTRPVRHVPVLVAGVEGHVLPGVHAKRRVLRTRNPQRCWDTTEATFDLSGLELPGWLKLSWRVQPERSPTPTSTSGRGTGCIQAQPEPRWRHHEAHKRGRTLLKTAAISTQANAQMR